MVFVDVADRDTRIHGFVARKAAVFGVELEQPVFHADLDVAAAVLAERQDALRLAGLRRKGPDPLRLEVHDADPVRLQSDIELVAVQQQGGGVVPGEGAVVWIPVPEGAVGPVVPVESVVFRPEPQAPVIRFDELADDLRVQRSRGDGRRELRDEALFCGRVVHPAQVDADPDAPLRIFVQRPDGVARDAGPLA